MHRRSPRVLASILVLSFALLAGCKQEPGPDFSAEVAKLGGELEAAREKVSKLAKELQGEKEKVAGLKVEVETARHAAGEKDQLVAQARQEAETVGNELAALRKSDAFVFAEIAAVEQKGLNGTAVERYRKFAVDFPESRLAPAANRAVAALTPTAGQEARFREAMIDPKRQEREVLGRFADGLVTIEEIAPLLKNKTSAEVIRLLGKPNSSFRNGTELGYSNKLIDTASGGKETLVITFGEKGVSGLRVGYRGREIRP